MSLRSAIDAMCRHCIYDPKSPRSWRQQVDACTAPNCPLFCVRPRSRGAGTDSDEKTISVLKNGQIGPAIEHHDH